MLKNLNEEGPSDSVEHLGEVNLQQYHWAVTGVEPATSKLYGVGGP
jgi:hypothetical protein